MRRRPLSRKLHKALGQRIRLRREQLGLAQRQLREASELSTQRHIWDIEQGHQGMTIDTARRIARALGWSLSRLFKGL